MGSYSVITACSYNLFHVPELSFHYGSTPSAERDINPASEYLQKLEASLRSFNEAAAYPPNQVFIGALDPHNLSARPWAGKDAAASDDVEAVVSGAFGDILEESAVLGLLKYSDSFDLVIFEAEFSETSKAALQNLDVLKNADLSKFDNGVSIDRIKALLDDGALALFYQKKLIGCVKAAHPEDPNLSSHIIFENLAAKAGAVYSVLKLIKISGTDPSSVDYIIETSEEACGDENQRGGGNFAKAIGELSGLINATGSDTRSFCAAPVHGILQAASLVKADTFKKIIVTAGGTTAKLAMNSKKHIEKGFPVLEDCMGAYAVLIEAGSAEGRAGDIIIRNDLTGIHRIGSGSSPQNVIQNLVADPLEKAGMLFDEIDYYAPELHNPEITEAGGAGNVTLANLKMIAAMAVMKKQIERTDIDSFIAARGSSGWAPTQGHIPSGIPALGWISKWFAEGRIRNAMIIGKGSLFLGRMTGLFDGVSIMLESTGKPAEFEKKEAPVSVRKTGIIRIGLTIPGSESGAAELLNGADAARNLMPDLEVVCIGDEQSDPAEAQRDMERALASGDIDAAVTFHYPFPLGTATVGLVKSPGSNKDVFIASTTGISDTDRVKSLVKNTLAGISAAKAWGIEQPAVGILNLDGARAALHELKSLVSKGWNIKLVKSARGDELLRGNDILAGTADVVVCDTLSGNAFIKLLGGFSSGGRMEITGSGYGPGIGGDVPLINIISRATGAAVVADALIYSARMAAAGLESVYRRELEASGLNSGEGGQDIKIGSSGMPGKKVVNREIEGIDVLQLDEAVAMLMKNGIYCEAGMGCTGPVVMLASEDYKTAEELLARHSYIEEEG